MLLNELPKSSSPGGKGSAESVVIETFQDAPRLACHSGKRDRPWTSQYASPSSGANTRGTRISKAVLIAWRLNSGGRQCEALWRGCHARQLAVAAPVLVITTREPLAGRQLIHRGSSTPPDPRKTAYCSQSVLTTTHIAALLRCC